MIQVFSISYYKNKNVLGFTFDGNVKLLSISIDNFYRQFKINKYYF